MNTPTPWRLGPEDIGTRGSLRLMGPDGKLIAMFEADRTPGDDLTYQRSVREDRANLALALTAVNAHDALLEALKACVADAILDKLADAGRWGYACTLDELEERFPQAFEHIAQARAAIKLAEGQP